MIYIFAMLTWLVTALTSSNYDNPMSQALYFPLFGFCSIFIINQARCEFMQWKNSDTNMDYFEDYWNMNDLIYLILNMTIMVMNLFDHERTIDAQRIFAAISSCFLWFKVFDWLRLFDQTAFFILLIQETLHSIKYFFIILVVLYMLFGTSFYMLNLGRLDDESFVPDVSPFWFFDGFLNMYELSLGEF